MTRNWSQADPAQPFREISFHCYSNEGPTENATRSRCPVNLCISIILRSDECANQPNQPFCLCRKGINGFFSFTSLVLVTKRHDSFREYSPNIADGTRSATRSFCRRELVRVFRRCKLVWLRPSVALNERYSSNSVRVRSYACKHRERQRKGGKRQTRWNRGRRFRGPRSRIFQARRVCAA